jgi:cytochrome c oxidase cbb3-type subunit 3
MNSRFVTRWLLLASLLPAVVAAQEAQLEEGRMLFESLCGSCHGPFGNGGKGANLAQPQLRRATDDQALQNIIRRGIPGTEMPSHFLTPQQISNVAAYVKTLGLIEPEEVPGDAMRGAETYASLDCRACHTLGGEGGIVGPLLDDVGARRSAAHIREALLTPDASVPNGFLQLRVVTEGGRSLTGIRVNEDGFSVQLRDLDGDLQSFWKDELQTLEKDWGRSPMATYEGRLTSEQLDDLVAYLVSLTGSQ